ncbi:oxidoreductase [Meridianimarinicoccus roseus]|uniref:Probable inorganic carbon transporter subunit DabB n=1 Tax=Meridianimarinicoccus roseus TaxID=2072018 RepID=A0A2V2L6Z2_9RHOB|nr:proton-conducting transporter membrane subunit [Meridianimarinicoccus roseus]PWR01208.1 oxidoreductase [Meridianimarinicoccus roseus]
MMIPPLSMLAPLVLLAVAAMAAAQPGRRPGHLPRLSELAALASLALALGGAAQLVAFGPVRVALPDTGAGFALGLDALSATMTVLVAFIGWVVMRYARTYLDGEAREGLFHGLMLAALAAVLVLVQAANLPVMILAFVAVGIALRHLLLFYPERPAARRAAAKFSIVWHAGDLALLAATGLLASAFGTVDLAALATAGSAAAAQGALPATAHLAVAALVLAAMLKTAAFPLHGWLTEVMEAPTPVSALLHAGIINGGGYLLIRTADVVQASPGGMAALVMLGGLTALFGAVVMLTQSAIKTALAWSTVAQMGFMLLQCGLGLWPLALLHIVAHSMYKAHAFLGSGGAVRAVAGLKRPGPVAVPDIGAVMKSFALALLLYGAVATLFSLAAGPKSPQALALGAMLIFGVAYLVAQGLADAAPAALTRRTGLAALGAALAYFTFQQVAGALWGAQLPPVPVAGPLEWALIVLAVASFGLVAFAQALFPLWAHHPATAGLRVHLANGLYLNALLDRLIGGFRAPASR